MKSWDLTRFDFVKGYAGNVVGGYIQNTTPKFAIGEMWDTDRQKVVEWVHSTGDRASAFDFPTKGILQDALKSNDLSRLKDSDGKPAGLIGLLPEKAITFIENHDTGSTQKIWPFPYDKLMQGYVYILTHPGIPTIFYDHFRKPDCHTQEKHINGNSNCKIITAESDLYMAAIDEKVVMKIGPRYDVGKFDPPSPEYRIATNGSDYCVWEKTSSSAD